jgi:hypothetical protein
MPGRSPATEVKLRPMTTMFHTWIALALLGLLVQLDILLAPSGLSKEAATRYDLAAVPSKGVYLVLAAASTFIFPYVRVRAQRKHRHRGGAGHPDPGADGHRQPGALCAGSSGTFSASTRPRPSS